MIYYISTKQDFLRDNASLGLGESEATDWSKAGRVSVKIIIRGESASDPELTAVPNGGELADNGLDDDLGKAACAKSARPQGMPGRKHLAKNLSRLRKEKGLTLDQVAAALGVSKPAVWGWENGRAAPQFDRLQAIAELFDVSVERLSGPSNHEGAVSLVVEACKQQIADAIGVGPENIRVTIAY